MAHQTTLILFAGLLTVLASNARQTQPLPTQPSPQTAYPCSGTAQQPTTKRPHTGIRLPPWLQRDINKDVTKLSNQTGIDIDPNTLNNAVKDAQTSHPCPAQTRPPASQSAPVSPNAFTGTVASPPAQIGLAGMWESSSPDATGCMLALNLQEKGDSVTGLSSLGCASPQAGYSVTNATVAGREDTNTGAVTLATQEVLQKLGNSRGCMMWLVIRPLGSNRMAALWRELPPCSAAGQAELGASGVAASHLASAAGAKQ